MEGSVINCMVWKAKPHAALQQQQQVLPCSALQATPSGLGDGNAAKLGQSPAEISNVVSLQTCSA